MTAMTMFGMTRCRRRLPCGCLLMPCLVLLCFEWLVPLSFVQGRAWDGNWAPRRQLTVRLGQQLAGRPSSADRQAKILTSQITKATSARKLGNVLDEIVDGPIFDSIHASAAYKRLEAFKKRGPCDKGIGMTKCSCGCMPESKIWRWKAS